MKSRNPHPKPSPVWTAVGLAMLAHFAALAWFKWSQNTEGELLWFSHAGLLLGALALILRSTPLAGASFTLVAGVHILWFADALAGMTTGDFPIGGTRYLLTADAPTLALTSHHIYLAPTLAIFLIRRRRIPLASVPIALALLALLTTASRLLLPASMNIDYAHAVMPNSTNPAFIWFNALPTPQYLAVHAAVCLLIFLIPSALIMKTLIEAHTPSKRTAARARVSPERAQATRLLARMGRSGGGSGFTLIELVAVLVVLAILAAVALPRYFDFARDAKDSADDASIAAINIALDNAFALHRAADADTDQWITNASQVASVMEGSELPYGITLNAGVFTDQRGNTYTFTPESESSAARIRLVANQPDNEPNNGGGQGNNNNNGGGDGNPNPNPNWSS